MLNIRSLSGLFVVFAFFSAKAMQQHRGAGITPFALNPNDKKVYLLVGYDTTADKAGQVKGWNSFGGRPKKNETPAETGAREAAEELMLILDDDQKFRNAALLKDVRGSQTYKELKSLIQKNEFFNNSETDPGWFIEIGYDENYPTTFKRRLGASTPNDWKEMNEIKWVSLEMVIKNIYKPEVAFSGKVNKAFAGGLRANKGILENIQKKFSSQLTPVQQQPAPSPTPVPQVTTTDPLQQSLDALRQSLDDLKTQLQVS